MELGNYIYGDILENGYLKLLYKKTNPFIF